MTDPMPLVGMIEIAQRACVQRPAVTMWRTRHPDFPAPVAELAVGPIFWAPDVDAWLVRTGRDRPPEQWWTRYQVSGKTEYGGPGRTAGPTSSDR